MNKALAILSFFGATAAYGGPLRQPGCDFCQSVEIQMGPIKVKGFEPPPRTSNVFSSLILDQSEHFVLKITRGAFVPFYFLIISKDHYTRVADIPIDVLQDLKAFKIHVESFFSEVLQQPFVVFEHGPARSGARGTDCSVETGGGCVDHLHLHILPFSGDIESTPDMNLPSRFEAPRTLSDLSELLSPEFANRPYIFYQNPVGELKLFLIRGYTPSQLLRLLIAETLGLHDEYNWRDFAHQGDFWANSAQSLAGYSTWLTQGPETARSKIHTKGWNERTRGDQELIYAHREGNCSTLLSTLEAYAQAEKGKTLEDFAEWLRHNPQK